ncbi:hypothetical protein [Methylobacterium sp. WCS2018Hpa-22]|uniref:hypothetical protein n=1 Tax=Methylobacterium sp. WCS2018Hpa-22 TaxID=3073633 RepID=UPI002889F34D|nr:hypothetical protein [Methylobacterium sp. WCS2018Hpa-22]
MTRNRFASLAILDRVEVGDFGSHPGVVIDLKPVSEIQGRAVAPKGWLAVRLDDGRVWKGHHRLVSYRAGAVRRVA